MTRHTAQAGERFSERLTDWISTETTLSPSAREPMDPSQLAQAAWPGERMLDAAATNRVRVAVAALRKAGLRQVLLTQGGAYLLDSTVAFGWTPYESG